VTLTEVFDVEVVKPAGAVTPILVDPVAFGVTVTLTVVVVGVKVTDVGAVATLELESVTGTMTDPTGPSSVPEFTEPSAFSSSVET
jgi:hypothetical protein